MSDVKSFRDLRTWQESQQLVSKIYELTHGFPSEERYALISQIRRAALSVSSNIAEGMGRGSAKDLSRFLIIARGSIQETLSLLESAKILGYLNENDFLEFTIRYNGLNVGINSHISQLSKYC